MVPAATTQPATAPPSPAPTPQAPAIPGPDWRRALSSWLAAHKTYPDAARSRGIEGSVSVRVSIDATGQVTNVTILQGSGSPILDAAAEALLRNASLPPPGAGAVTVSLRLNYKLTD
jgi:protein TonB